MTSEKSPRLSLRVSNCILLHQVDAVSVASHCEIQNLLQPHPDVLFVSQHTIVAVLSEISGLCALRFRERPFSSSVLLR